MLIMLLHVAKRYHPSLAPVWKSRNRWWKAGYALTVQDLLSRIRDSERFDCCMSGVGKCPFWGIIYPIVG